MKILQWNCHSLYNKLCRFKVHLYNNLPHIVCLSETWLKQSHEPNFINYTKYLCNRESSQGGGIGILVRNDIISMEKALSLFPNGKLEIQAISIFNKNIKIDIMNVYNPNETMPIKN